MRLLVAHHFFGLYREDRETIIQPIHYRPLGPAVWHSTYVNYGQGVWGPAPQKKRRGCGGEAPTIYDLSGPISPIVSVIPYFYQVTSNRAQKIRKTSKLCTRR